MNVQKENGNPILYDNIGTVSKEYLGIEMLAFYGYPQHLMFEAFLELETIWKTIPGSIPHMGKNFGFHRKADGTVAPFERSMFSSEKFTSNANRALFEQKRSSLDPNKIFFTSQASWILDPVLKQEEEQQDSVLVA